MSVVHVNSISGITSITSPSSSDVLTLHTSNNAERLRIQANGSVGIGTNDASWGLSGAGGLIVGSGAVSQAITIFSGSSSNGDISFGDATSGTARYRGLIRYSHSDNSFAIRTNSNERIHIDSSGLIGIGTDDPQRNLHIHQNTAANAYLHMTNATTGASTTDGFSLYVATDGQTYYRARESTGTHIFYTGTTERLRIDSEGDVRFAGTNLTDNTNKSVNLTAPSYDTDEEDVNLVQVENESGFNQISFGGGTSGLNAATNLRFLTASAVNTTTGTERLRIKSDGDVEIGGNLKTNNLPGRNIIINGAMQVAQRKPSGEYTGQANYATVDRMYGQYSVPNTDPVTECHVLTSGDTGPWEKGFRKSYRMKIGYQGTAGVGHFYGAQHRIEAQDIVNSGWDYTSSSSYITLSFWIKSSVAYNPSWYLRVKDNTAKIYRWQPGTLSANTWTKVTKTFPGDSSLNIDNDNGEGLQVNLSPYWGTNYSIASPNMDTWENFVSGSRAKDTVKTWFETNGSTMEITGLQLEVGSQATEFEHLPYAEHLRRCQRYYYVHALGENKPVCTSANYGSVYSFGHIPFPVEMRADGVLDAITGTNYFRVYANGTSDLFDNVGLQATSTTGYILQCDTNLSVTQGHGSWIQTANAAARIAFKAEL